MTQLFLSHMSWFYSLHFNFLKSSILTSHYQVPTIAYEYLENNVHLANIPHGPPWILYLQVYLA